MAKNEIRIICEEGAIPKQAMLDYVLSQEQVLALSQELVERSEIALLGSLELDGRFPNIKAMFKMESEGIHTIWFATSTLSCKTKQLAYHRECCVYFYDSCRFSGLQLVGYMDIKHDQELKKRVWQEGFQMVYPQGPDDPTYCVLEFTSIRGNYYQGKQNVNFEII